MSQKLSVEPTIHPTATVNQSTLGRYTEVGERCRIDEVEFGDYSYIERDGMIWCATIGKFANLAASVRINATNHPTWRATLPPFHLSRLQLLAGCRHGAGFLCLAA